MGQNNSLGFKQEIWRRKKCKKVKIDNRILCMLPFTNSFESTFRNEKIVALLVSSSFMLVTNSILQRIFVLTTGVSQVIHAERNSGINTELIRIQCSFMAKRSGRKGCHVSSLVATDNVLNNFSLLESILLLNSHAAIRSKIKFNSLNSH